MNLKRIWDTQTATTHLARPALLLALAVTLFAVAVGCCGAVKPLERHAELNWEMRERMPEWGPLEWNAWEASLAAALNKPEPDEPLFPEAAPQDQEVNDEDE